MLDGIHLGEHLMVVALGITDDGTKVPLGVVEGSTENAAVCTRLVTDLVDRGLDASHGVLFVVDGWLVHSRRRSVSRSVPRR